MDPEVAAVQERYARFARDEAPGRSALYAPLDISREYHARIKNQRPAVLWLTGLSGSGKSTIANALERKLDSVPG